MILLNHVSLSFKRMLLTSPGYDYVFGNKLRAGRWTIWKRPRNLIIFSCKTIKIQSGRRELQSVAEKSPIGMTLTSECVYETWIKLFVIQQHCVAILLFGFVLSPRECLRNSWEKRTFPKSEENYKTKSTINEKRQRWARFYYCVMCRNYQKAVHYHQQWE